MDEIKQDNFKRIAENRTNKIINYIDSLGNLTNSSFYEFTDEQIDEIFDAIQKELDETHEKIKNRKQPKNDKFKL